MSGKEPDIQQMLSKSLGDRISTNRQKLSSIMKTIVFLWSSKHFIMWSLRLSSCYRVDASEFHNHVNFSALFKFNIDAVDFVIQNHLGTAAQNANPKQNHIHISRPSEPHNH